MSAEKIPNNTYVQDGDNYNQSTGQKVFHSDPTVIAENRQNVTFKNIESELEFGDEKLKDILKESNLIVCSPENHECDAIEELVLRDIMTSNGLTGVSKEISQEIALNWNLLWNHIRKDHYAELDKRDIEMSKLNSFCLYYIDLVVIVLSIAGILKTFFNPDFQISTETCYAELELTMLLMALFALWAIFMAYKMISTRNISRDLIFIYAIYVILLIIYGTCTIYDYHYSCQKDRFYGIERFYFSGIEFLCAILYAMYMLFLYFDGLSILVWFLMWIYFFCIFIWYFVVRVTELYDQHIIEEFFEVSLEESLRIKFWTGKPLVFLVIFFIAICIKLPFLFNRSHVNYLVYYATGMRICFLVPLFFFTPFGPNSRHDLLNVTILYLFASILYILKPLNATERVILEYELEKSVKNFDLSICLQCHDLSNQIYKASKRKAQESRSLSTVELRHNVEFSHDTHYHLLYYNEMIYIVFRGTSSSKNIKTDLDYDLIEIDPLFFPISKQLGENMKIHAGFYAAYVAIREHLHYCIEKMLSTSECENPSIVVCGHSLGGALATICAFDISLQYNFDDLTVYNFGCPRVGNRKFAHVVNERIPKLFRVVYQGDAVYSVPPIWKGYVHCGIEVWISGNGDTIFDMPGLLRDAMPFRIAPNDHRLKSYKYALDKLCLNLLENKEKNEENVAQIEMINQKQIERDNDMINRWPIHLENWNPRLLWNE